MNLRNLLFFCLVMTNCLAFSQVTKSDFKRELRGILYETGIIQVSIVYGPENTPKYKTKVQTIDWFGTKRITLGNNSISFPSSKTNYKNRKTIDYDDIQYIECNSFRSNPSSIESHLTIRVITTSKQ